MAPSITTQPHNQSVIVGQKATFTMAASGTSPLSYQWKKGDVVISGATSSSYTTGVTTKADDGASFTVTVSNNAGSMTSNAATLTVNEVQPVQNGSRYLPGSILSPITPTVATRLQALFNRGIQNGLKADVFFKVGDSITVNSCFLDQFKYPAFDPDTMYGWDYAYNLGDYPSLEGARAYFLLGRIGSENPCERVSLSAAVGQDGAWALEVPSGGSLCPLDQEMQAAQGAYGIVMFGTNDFGLMGDYYTEADIYQLIIGNTFLILDRCIASGTLPLLTAPPPDPMGDDQLMLSRMTSRLLRATAQGRQVPFMDYYASLLDLPHYGLNWDATSGYDVHPNVMDYDRACFLTTEGLQFGHNMRNLITLQTLDRVYRLLTKAGAAPDAETGGLQGSGLASDPYVVDGLDFSDYQKPAGGMTEVVYTLTVTGSGGTWKFAAAGHDGDTFGIELRNSQGTPVGSSAMGALTQTLSAETYTIHVNFQSGIQEFVFASVAGSCR